MRTILILLLLALAVSIGWSLPASLGVHPLPAWLESLAGPPETIPPGTYAGCKAMLHTDDWVWGTYYLGTWRDGVGGYSRSERFELYGGESLFLYNWTSYYDSGSWVVKDSVVCESHGDSVLAARWGFHVGPRHHGGIGIARVDFVNWDFADTFWNYTPGFELANYGHGADSGWALATFSDTMQDRVFYNDSARFSLTPGQSQVVHLQPVRFHSLGPHVGTYGWTSDAEEADSLSWEFDVRVLQHGDIGFSHVDIPRDTIDTLRTWHPRAKVRVNYMTGYDSLWLTLRFSDTAPERVVYADSHHLLLWMGCDTLVGFRPIRFTVPGPYHSQLDWRCMHGFGDTLAGDFWVDATIGVGEVARNDWRMSPHAVTIVRGVLWLRDCHPAHGDCRNVDCTRAGGCTQPSLLDIAGRNVMELAPGSNDVRHLAPGVYFVREEPQASSFKPKAVRKVVVTR